MKKRQNKNLRSPKAYPITKNHTLLHEYSVGFARKLNGLRKLHNLTQIQLARKADIPQKVISNFESGWANPSLSNLVRLAKFFEIPVSDLIVKNQEE